MMVVRMNIAMDADGDVSALVGTEIETDLLGSKRVGTIDEAEPVYDEGVLIGAVLRVRLP